MSDTQKVITWKEFVSAFRKANPQYSYSQSLVICSPAWEKLKSEGRGRENTFSEEYKDKVKRDAVRHSRASLDENSARGRASEPVDIPKKKPETQIVTGEAIQTKTRKPRSTKEGKLRAQLIANERRQRLLELEKEKIRLELGEDNEEEADA